MSESSIMSVREMIDTCFGDHDINIVNFKLMQTILYLLARQQRLLERRVAIEFGRGFVPRTSSLSITEIKLKANVFKKKKKITKQGAADGVASAKSKADKYSKSTTDDTTTSTDKPFKSRPRPISTDVTFSKSTTDKTSTSKSTTERTSKSSTDKTATSKSTTDKTSTSKSSTDKTSTLKSPSEKSTTDKTSSKSTTEKSKTSKSTASADKKSIEATKDKATTLKHQADISISDKSKPTRETTKSSSDKSKSSSDKMKTSTVKARDRDDESIREKAKKRDYHHLLEIIEQEREQELRVVNQRADSQEVAEKPTPMASLDSMEAQYEKLLVVERLPREEAEKRLGRAREDKISKLDIVTQGEFDELVDVVKDMQRKFGFDDNVESPENIQLMDELSRGASLTDARSALLLSARLEYVEKTLNVMEDLLTDLAIKKGIKQKQQRDAKEHAYAVQFTRMSVDTSETKAIVDEPSDPSNTPGKSSGETEDLPIPEPPFTGTEDPVMEMLEGIPKTNNINIDELDDAMQELYQELVKSVGALTKKAINKADEALKSACRLETKLDAAMDVDARMGNLELLITEYTGKINSLDTCLSSQMSNYQEQLTQMQHDLEGGLEIMAESLANPAGEVPGAVELNTNFANLQVQFDITNMRQTDLKENQAVLSLDVQALWKEIELLREIKADRDEVADALRDKAGLGALNGLVTQQQFDAVRGDFEQRIGASYDKFNNQETVWQKIIDDLMREINEKADCVQVSALRDDINNNLEKLRNKIHAMMEIIGEPRAAAISRRLLRDAACLSCSSPAHMNLEEPNLPALPEFPKASTRPQTIGAEDTRKPKEDGDGLCYPGKPIPHAIDPRSYYCRRYCGGPHTAVRARLSRPPAELSLSNLRPETTGLGSDGKVYVIDEQAKNKKPCLPCNIPPHVSEERKDTRFDSDSDAGQYYVFPVMTSMGQPTDSFSVTPPAPRDED